MVTQMTLPQILLTTALFLIACNARADLVAHYALDETDPGNNTVTDSLGLNHGTIISPGNVTKGLPGPHGAVYDFGLRGGVNIPPASEIRPDDQFTITWWFRPTTLNAFDRLYESLAGTGNDGNGIRIDLGSSGDNLRALLRDGNGSTNTTVIHPLDLNTNIWYFFALRYDSLDGSCRVTVMPITGGDVTAGDITSATTTNTSLGTNAISHATGVFIAADDAGAAGSNDFGGAMDDIAFFQTGDTFGVLSDADLAAVYNDGALAFDPPAPKPTISSFSADATEVASGSTVTFSWDVADADTIEIDQGIGNVANPSGTAQITATLTKIYTLTATNAEGSVSQPVQITVDGLALPPEISEFVASNSNFDDGDGNSSDWIEIHNPNANPFDLSGFQLVAGATTWTFPAGTVLDGNEYLIVFASGQAADDYVDAAGNLHTSFSLDADGENLSLLAPNGAQVQGFLPFPEQNTDTSYTEGGFLATPSPGAENIGTPLQGFLRDTSFAPDRGFYTDPITVTIGSTPGGADIYYTLDGSEPSPTNGTLYTGGIPISTTTVLRAAAFMDDFLPTNVDTQTYLFLDDVLTQPNNPPNTVATWAGHPADYEMDPDIVSDLTYAADLIPALEKFATLSIAIDPDDFYGPQGIYQNPQSQGIDWERPVSAELIDPDGSETGFQVDAGLRIQGGSSRNPDTPKHSMSLRFRNDYGAGKLRYPLFEDAPYGDSAVEKFDTLQLRSGYNFGWTHRHYYQCHASQYNRDQFANDLLLAIGSTGSHGRWIHLYINGIYWGIYHIHERPDQNFMAAYFGGDGDDYDAINSNRATAGTATAYTALKQHGAAGLSDPADYEVMKSHLDIDSFIDYMLVNFYVGNRDWDGHNWRAAGQGVGGVPFRYFCWDTEFAISPWAGGVFQNPADVTGPVTLNTNVTERNNNNGPTGVHQDLRGNAEYRLRFADRAHAALFNGGPMTPEGATAIWRRRSDCMDVAIVAESARWGDFRRDVEAGSQWNPSQYDLFTRDDHYLPVQDWIINTYLQQRTDIVISQLRAQNLYPAIDAPTYSQAANLLTITNPNAGGVVYYTTDGSDPRQPTVAGGDPVPLIAENAPATALVQLSDGGLGTSWHDVGFDDATWQSGTAGVGFESNPDVFDELINIYVNNMQGNNASCLVRVEFNIPDQATLDGIGTLLLDMRYDDGFAAFINGTPAASANDPATLTWNSSTGNTTNPDGNAVNFERFDASAAIGALQVGANMLAIHGLNSNQNSSDFLISPKLSYQTSSATGISPSAVAYSAPLDLQDSAVVNARVLDNGTWSALQSDTIYVGTPADASNLTVSEVHYNPPGQAETDEFIELKNISAQTIDLSDCSFAAGLTYAFPVGTSLAPGAYVVLRPTDFEGNLDNGGERITLNDVGGAVIESFTYNDRSPWPEAADGDGFSLVRISPESKLDPDLPTSWRPSASPGGNAGGSDATSFPGGDAGALLAYAFGNAPNPLTPGSALQELTLTQNLAADDLIYTIEGSADLTGWQPFATVLTSETSPVDGLVLRTYQSSSAGPPPPRQFFRVRVELR